MMTLRLAAWSDHPVMAYFALKGHPYWNHADSVEAKSLHAFLTETEAALEEFLERQELWSVKSIPDYSPRPNSLAFRAGGDQDDIVKRFLHAIRMNPNSKVPLYLYLMPDQNIGDHALADPSDISTLRNVDAMRQTIYIWVDEGEMLAPLDVLTTANNEPDYGFDLGLFEDNGTAYGNEYGFGKQPFGNPNLEYSSQAPFHMGFYHEAGILYTFGPFLKHTFLDYRVNLFRDLSVFAFEQNQDYWGWRFLGWSMHYAGDATMPYHCKPLPGYGVLRMIWINLKAMLGFTKGRDHAVQLVSNKHTVIEEYQQQEMSRAYLAGETEHPFFEALQNPGEIPVYQFRLIRDHISHRAVDRSRHFDQTIKNNMPAYMVSDPEVEVIDLQELANITSLVRQQKGANAIQQLNGLIAERFSDLSMTIRSLMDSVIEESGPKPKPLGYHH